MIPTNPDKTDRKQRVFNVVLAVAAAQVGCLTLVIVVAAVLAGLWLDNRFDTKPLLTLALLVASIPVSVVLMLVVVRRTVARMDPRASQPKIVRKEEISGIDTDD